MTKKRTGDPVQPIKNACTVHSTVLGGDTIHGLLSGCVRVDGGHQTLLDSDALLVKSSSFGDFHNMSQQKVYNPYQMLHHK